MRGVVEPEDAATVVVVAHHSLEGDDRARVVGAPGVSAVLHADRAARDAREEHAVGGHEPAPASAAGAVLRVGGRVRGGMHGAAGLLEHVVEDPVEEAEAVAHAARRARQVHDERAAREPRVPAREHRGGRVGRADAAGLLHDPGDLEVEQRRRRLGRAVGGGDARAARGEDHARAAREGLGERRGDPWPVGADDRRAHLEPALGEPRGDDGAGAVLVLPRRGARGGDDHDGAAAGIRRAHCRAQSTDLPPCFSRTSTSVITARASTALTMS